MEMPKVTIRLDATGALLNVDVEGASDPTDLVEERAPVESPPYGGTIKRNWLAAG